MQLQPTDIHLWSTDLTRVVDETKLAFLSPEEHDRANRFHFPLHRHRFIAARITLRYLLSLYLDSPPDKIVFSYSEYKKPYLATHPHLFFNIAHSHDIALYAFTLNHTIGVDIEKIREHYEEAIAKRYFSPYEYQSLMQLPKEAKAMAFYRLWSRKEALTKAIGKGLHIPLSNFSVSINENVETINLENDTWTLVSLPLYSDYQSAIASNQSIKNISYWHIIDQQPKLIKVYPF